jgi:hypothetical protein
LVALEYLCYIRYSNEAMESLSEALDGVQRQLCWQARDAYMECLSYHCRKAIYRDDEDTIRLRCPSECNALRDKAAAACPQLWLAHFERKWAVEQLKAHEELHVSK